MNRRAFLIGAAALSAPPFADGQSVVIGGAERVLTDIIAPSLHPLSGRAEPFADFAAAALSAAILAGAPVDGTGARDRWGRFAGALSWKMNGRTTTLQEVLLAQGAARVAPQSEDFPFIERCYRAEKAAREAGLGLWRHPAYRVRDAARAEKGWGYQIYAGAVRAAAERGGRVFFNFGDDFRADFTASALRGDFRRWRGRPDAASFVGKTVEIRGFVDWINGPSIELRHELQLQAA
jgi:endonuclease YncB( thermonuclease family)